MRRDRFKLTVAKVAGSNVAGLMHPTLPDHFPPLRHQTREPTVEDALTALHGTKQIDLFQPWRTLAELVRESAFDHIGLRRSIPHVSIDEIEVSRTAYDYEVEKVIAAATGRWPPIRTCALPKNVIVAHFRIKPLGKGLLAGTITKREDLDLLIRIAEAIKAIAKKGTRERCLENLRALMSESPSPLKTSCFEGVRCPILAGYDAQDAQFGG
ncbi:hypothetical protein L226DRAFT_520656 [Lentinus tigrinus ALCF2SS1-7]|uniref:uncharacterized protein n=1 Tax=Lentinus tigrinus ALCF2SS1-7 TaxID=1328758 RepID=UPI0011662273|nr:hypothetical protein L226DRAFT_520656 [Lentinus tigrinus ALCF2SS1-7]